MILVFVRQCVLRCSFELNTNVGTNGLFISITTQFSEMRSVLCVTQIQMYGFVLKEGGGDFFPSLAQQCSVYTKAMQREASNFLCRMKSSGF